MAFKRLNAPTLKELFIQELETMILSGELPIGSKLPPEREMAQTMQISRSIVNSGIVEMADKGFLEINPRKGTFVADYQKNGKLDILISVMKYNGGQLPQTAIRSILELRRVLVNFALELSVPNMTNEQYEWARNQCELLKSAKTPKEAAEIMFDFEHKLSGYSGNTLLPLIFSSFKSPNMTLWERFFKLHGTEYMVHRNDELLKHMEERNLPACIHVIDESIKLTISGSKSIYYD